MRELLASGDLRYTDLATFGDPAVSSFDMDEYFDYAVRLEVLSDFFASAPNALVRHKLCDLAFAQTLRKQGVRSAHRGVERALAGGAACSACGWRDKRATCRAGAALRGFWAAFS